MSSFGISLRDRLVVLFQDLDNLRHHLCGNGLIEVAHERGLVRSDGRDLGWADNARNRQAEISVRRSDIDVVWPSIVSGSRNHGKPNQIERSVYDAV